MIKPAGYQISEKASEEMFQALIEGSVQGIYVHDESFRMLFVNEAGAKILGYQTVEEVVGMDLFEGFIFPHEREISMEHFQKVISGKPIPNPIEAKFLRKDGTEIWLERIHSRVMWEGKPALLATATDITERKRAGEALRESEAQYRAIFNASSDGLNLSRLDGTLVAVNPAMWEIHGYTRKEFLKLSPPDWVHPDSMSLVKEFFHSISQGKEYRCLAQNIHKDGSVIDVEIHGVPITYKGETHVLGIVRDVTERKQAEEALRDSEERLRKIYAGAHDAIFVLDQDHECIVETNPRACEWLGYSAKEINGMSIKRVHPREMEVMAEIMEELRANKLVRTEQLTCTTKDHRAIPADITFTMIQIKNRNYVLAVVRDITERKKAEQAIRNALAEVEELKNRLQEENIYLQNEIKVEHNFGEIIGLSASLKKVLGQVEQVAPTDATVLILGETGTGKELFARAVHNISDRRDRPLVKVNCAVLPPNLIESELFGHERGAFTGALARKIGRFELADGGTIFLDEIGDLPLELQVKLLNVLQEGEFERLGNAKTMKVDVRIIAATNRDLQKAIANGDFREDLFYRLNVFPIAIPSLRERTEDIPFLARHFIKKFCVKMGKEIDTIPERVMSTLNAYDWPGNVRELENIIERAVILTSGPALQVEELVDDGNEEAIAKPQTLQEIEHQHIRQTLAECNWKISGANGAAEILGMHPNTLRDRMQKHGLKKPQHRT